MTAPNIVIINGPPGAGKTTLGKRLAADLRWPFIGKDDVKEILFDSLGLGDRAWSIRLGVASIELIFHRLERELEAERSAVMESAFVPSYDRARFVALQEQHRFEVYQIYCDCDPDVLVARFFARDGTDERHSGHIVAGSGPADFLRTLKSDKYGVLDIGGQLMTIDTTDFDKLDYSEVLADAQAWMNVPETSKVPGTLTGEVVTKRPFAKLDNLLQEACDAQQIAGAVTSVIHRGQPVHQTAVGLIDIAAGKPMQPDTIFRIASMTKPITAVAVLMLVDEGRFALDDPVAKYLPEFAEAQVYVDGESGNVQLAECECDITIRQLLTHTSGICLGAGGDDPVEVLWTEAIGEMMSTPGITLQSAVRTLAKLPLASQPGTAWRYGLSFEVLAALVEVVSGQWFDQFLRRRIFEPLGMVDSGYVIRPENAGRLSALYRLDSDDRLNLLETPAESPHVLMFGYELGTVWTTGGDMLVSTAADYGRFLQMLLNGGAWDGVRLLKPETVAEMTRGQLSPSVRGIAALESGYDQGLAVRVLDDVNQASGLGTPGESTHAGGHGTYFWVNPQQELIGLLMLQLNPIPEALHRQFRAAIYRALDTV